MHSTILTLFGTGQVTLPKKWRDQFNAKHFQATIQGKTLTLKPIEQEIVFFDADEFNEGEGVSLQAFHKALKNSLRK
jgi:bifunctional DNA-binding transcriptional regulator/antitoxin component of YhaV-PrlF toxin-antitoxin module